MLKKIFKMFGYVLFALMVGLGLILYRFPYDSLSKRLEAEASQRLGCDLNIEELGFQFPLSLGFSRVSIESPDPDLLKEMVVNSGKIRIRPLALVSRKVDLGVNGDFLAGSLQGSIELSPLLEPEYFECALNWRDIDLDTLNLSTKTTLLSSLQGSLSGDLHLQGRLHKWLEASGSGGVELTKGLSELALPGVKKIRFQELEGSAEVALENRELIFGRIVFSGRGVRGKAQGSARLEIPLSQSRLRLEGRIDLNSAAPEVYSLARKHMNKTTFPFVLQGPLQGLTYRLR